MLEAAMAMRRFVAGRERDALRDEVLFWALVAQVAVLGEAASRVSEVARDRLLAIPWSEIVGMRNQIIHGYWAIDPDELWRTIDRDIPVLIAILQAELGATGADTETS